MVGGNGPRLNLGLKELAGGSPLLFSVGQLSGEMVWA